VLSVLDTISSPAMAEAVTASLLERMEPGLAWFYADVVAGVMLLVVTRGRVAPRDTRSARWRLRMAMGLSALGARHSLRARGSKPQRGPGGAATYDGPAAPKRCP
jgi:hypothetical protein